MNTQNSPNITNDSAMNVLRLASEASRRCRGICAARHAGLVYLLGCYRTWMGAAAVLQAPDADETLAAVMNASNRTATSLMKTLRVYASQCPVDQIRSRERDASPHDTMSIEMEILSQEDWLASADMDDEGAGDPIVDAASGLTPAQVYSHLDAFSDDVPGYWLLGRLEASTGLQAALALAVVSIRDAGQRVAQLRTAVALQYESARTSLQLRIDAINCAHPFLRATSETLFVEGLDTENPRLIVVDGVQSPHMQSHPR